MPLDDLKSTIETQINQLKNQLYEVVELAPNIELDPDHAVLLASAIYQLKDTELHLKFAYEDEIITDEEKKDLLKHSNDIERICTTLTESLKITEMEENSIITQIHESSHNLFATIYKIKTKIQN